MRLQTGLCLLAAVLLPQISSKSVESIPRTSGIKMTTRFGTTETTNEQTVFLKGDRSRTEYRSATVAVHGDGTPDTRPGPSLASIARCDLGQIFDMNLEDREYAAAEYPAFKLTKEQIEARLNEMKKRRDNIFQKVAPWVPTVREETATVDTGERKNFYGHEARHLIKTWKRTPLAGSHLEQQDNVTDGWYIDLDTSIACEFRWPRRNEEPRHEYYAAGAERFEIIDDGIRETGFVIERKYSTRSISRLPDGTKRPTVYSNEEKITEFYEGPLNLALFEVPSNFRKVKEVRREPPLTLADRWYLTRGWVKSLAHDLLN